MTAKTRIWMKLVVFLCLMLAGTAGATAYTLTVSTNGSGSVNRNPSNSSLSFGSHRDRHSHAQHWAGIFQAGPAM